MSEQKRCPRWSTCFSHNCTCHPLDPNVLATLTSSPQSGQGILDTSPAEPVTLEPDWREHPEHIAWQQRRDDRNDFISRVIARAWN